MNDLQAKSTNTLALCPFCGGEATVERIGKSGYYYVACNTAYCCDFGKFDTEAEAIAAWNTRVELGSERHAYEQRITCDGSDWGEIMRGAYDDLMASACESCTPEQMEQLADYIRAELGSGTCNPVETEALENVTAHVMECDRCGKVYEHVNGAYEHCPRCGRRVER